MISLSGLHAIPFYELTALLMVATVVGFISLLLRQPMIVSFIAVGMLVGPSFFGIVHSYENIELLAELGIAVLLFLVGLKLDIHLIKTLGFVSLATGLGQVVFTAIIGFLIAIQMGMDTTTSIYVAIALTFSSTIIIVKLLSDKHEVDSLQGRIAIGLLIVQDVVVVLAMLVLSAFSVSQQGAGNTTVEAHIATMLMYTGIMLVSVIIFINYIANPLVRRIAHSPELLIIFSISWAALLATLGSYFGFSKELGGLLAGVSLASTPFRDAISARLSSLRDFLLLFFFVALGSQLNFLQLESQIIPAIIFSVFVLIGNPLIVLIIMGYMGYRKRTSFLVGLTVAQISEFSLIFMAMGLKIGHVNSDALGLVTLVGLITIALSVYMITYSNHIYRWLEPALSVFERAVPFRQEAPDESELSNRHYDVILFGLGRYGRAIVKQLLKEKFKVLAIDFNPVEVQKKHKKGLDVLYGDASDLDFLSTLPLTHVKWVICVIPQHVHGLTHEDPRRIITEGLRQQKFSGKIAISSKNTSEINSLKKMGVDLVFLPFFDAAKRAVERIQEDAAKEN